MKLTVLLCLIGCLAVANATTGACMGCAAGNFPKAKATAGCGACAQGAITTCNGDATKKVLKTAATLCPVTYAAHTTPAVATVAEACDVCPAGTYPNAVGTTGCTACAVPGNANLCTGDATKKLLKSAAEVCVTAPAIAVGSAAPTTVDTACKICGAGTYPAATGTPGCVACAVPANANLCTAHAHLKILKSAAEVCVTAPALAVGSVAPATATAACKACPIGQFPNPAGTNGGVGCSPCVQGAANLCSADTALKHRKTAAELCPAGYTATITPVVTSKTVACAACPAGKFSKADTTTVGCTDCAANCAECVKDAANAAGKCTKAVAGFHIGSAGTPVACLQGAISLCTADAKLKTLNLAVNICPAKNAFDCGSDHKCSSLSTAAGPVAAAPTPTPTPATATSASVSAAALLLAAIAARVQ